MRINKSLHHWTPTLLSQPLSHMLGKPVWLKMECYQPVGSFKIRGIGQLCEHFKKEGKTHLVSSSGGNAGLATVYAGNKLGMKTTVFIPKSSNQIFINAIKLEGGEVIIEGDVWDEANEAAIDFANQKKAGFVPPFDHPLIWKGHSTMIDEIAADDIKPDCVVVAVGGGGLASGVLEGMHRHQWTDIPLIAVETEGTASLHNAMSAGEVVTLTKIDSIATSLGAKRVCQNIVNWTKKHSITPVTVTDKDCIYAMRAFLDNHRVLVEPASGAPLSLAYNQDSILDKFDSVLIIVCGGVGISLSLLQSYL